MAAPESTIPAYEALPDSTPLVPERARLRARAAADGVLLLRDLLPRDRVLAVGDQVRTVCQAAGWCNALGQATHPPVLEGHEGWFEVYDPLQRLEAFHALAHHPALTGLVELLVNEMVLVHPRNIGRVTFPGAAWFSTPPHQDYPLIQGAPDTWTAWLPLVDCPLALGGLAMLPGSHRLGLLPVHAAAGPGGLGVETAGCGLFWRAQDLRAGDVLLFHSHTVHRALPNLSTGDLRLSVDYRYQGVGQPVVADSLQPHYGRLGWDAIYEDWSDAALQYYWQRWPLQVVDRDTAIMTPR